MRRSILFAFALAVGAFAPPLFAQTPQPHLVLVEIQGFAFVPAMIEVAVGDTVVWTNHDFVPHTATADDESWTTPELPVDAAGRVVMQKAGLFTYHCRYHPAMKATILVK